DNHRLQKFDPSGNHLEVIGSMGQGKGRFLTPQKLAIHQNKLYVVDSNNNNLQIFDISTYITDVSAAPTLFSPNDDGKFDTTTISYTIPETAHVTINIYDKDGNLIRNLVNEDRPAGTQTKVWDGKDDSARIVADGEYTYVINAVNALNYHAPQKKGSVWIDNTPPQISYQKATPETVIVGNTITLTAQIKDVNVVASATINLMPILNNANQPMFDDGTYGDEIANDEVYTYKTTIPGSVSCGVKSLIIRAEDMVSNQSQATITLQLINPKITSVLPTSGTIGTKVTIKGEGYLPSESIRIDFGTILTIGLTTTNAQGSFTAAFTVDSQPYGLKTITATGLISCGVAKSIFT
ncbi:MAG: FlgD immunoglobulin-like domain containing protein, partial [bacterium]